MRRAERLFRLVNEMRSRGTCRAEDLAVHFEVSVSTIYRDIAHLQGSGLPIEGEAGIGYILRPGFDLPTVTFTYDQLDALAVGLAFVERTGDPELAEAAREARDKLHAALPDPSDRALTHAPVQAMRSTRPFGAEAALLRGAIRSKRIVAFDYIKGDGALSTRRLRPLVILDLTDGWMVSGWCELRRDFRTFRADRLRNLSLTETTFIADETVNIDAFMARAAANRPPT